MILPPPEKKYDRIAFFGPMASGKTFCASYLMETRHFKRLSFAAKLKEIAADLFGVTSKDNAGRRILQNLGAGVRDIQPDAWINYALAMAPRDSRLVVDDLRYLNETEALRNEGFIIIRTWVPEKIRQERIANLYPDTDPTAHQHSSETDMYYIEPDFYLDSRESVTMCEQLEYIMSGAYDNNGEN